MRFQSYLAQSDAVIVLVAMAAVPLAAPDDSVLVDEDMIPVFVAATLWWLALGIYGSRDYRTLGVGHEEYKRIVAATVHLAGVTAAAAYLSRTDTARGYLLLGVPVGLGVLLLSRWGWRQWLHARRRRGPGWSHRVLVVGSGPQVTQLCKHLDGRKDLGHVVVGTWVVTMEQSEDAVATARAVLRRARRGEADVIAVTACEAIGAGVLRRLGWLLEGTDLQLIVVPGLTAMAGPRVRTRPAAGLHLLCIEEPAFTGISRIAKRLFDIVFSATSLIALCPVLAVIGLAVRLDSPGPVFHRQTRIGRHGRPFTMVKIRTMVADAEQRRAELARANECDGPLFKIREDPRLTRVGRILRRHSLDELPQLASVLLGRMSLVGPRPPLPEEVQQYAKDTRRRLLVKPGLTGLWQISGRSDLSWTDGIALDLHYVENWSFTTDLVILWKTLRVVMAGTGAY